jgi:vacuolar-type H+-ATPase subunit C/Vma6
MFGIGYSAINAKVRYWMSYIARPEDIALLANSELSDIVDFIRKREVKADIEISDVREIEKQIKQAMIEYIKSAKLFLTGAVTRFLDEILKGYEIENLKTVTRSIIGEKPLDFLYQISPNDIISGEVMRDVKSLDLFKEFLRNTEYYPLAANAFNRIKETGSVFHWEMELDNYHALKLYDAARRLKGEDFNAVKKLIFFSEEMKRLVWLYRVRFHYRMTTEEAMTLVPNIFGVLSKNRYRTLASLTRAPEFFTLLEEWRIIREPVTTIVELEKVMNRMLTERTVSYLEGNPFSFGLFLSFFVLKRQNIKTFIILLEGKRNNLSKTALERILIY